MEQKIWHLQLGKCKDSFGDIADFLCGTEKDVPNVDVIIASNVFEHLTNDKRIVKVLKEKTKKTLYNCSL